MANRAARLRWWLVWGSEAQAGHRGQGWSQGPWPVAGAWPTAVCRNVSLEECQEEEVFYGGPQHPLQLLAR